MTDIINVQRGSGVALWRQIEQAIEREISEGTYKEGERLPTEPELARMFGVNRHTLRRAMRALAERGLLRIEQGRGTFVQEDVIDYTLGRRTRFSQNILQRKRSPGGTLLDAREVIANGVLAEELEIPLGTPLIRLDTLHEADERPIDISTSYFPAKRFPNLISLFCETHSITQALAGHGVDDYFRRVTRITAKVPETSDAQRLRQPPTRPVLVTEYVNEDANGVAIQFAVTRFAADRVQLTVQGGGD